MSDMYISEVGYLLVGEDSRNLQIPIRCFADENVALKYLENYEKTNELVVEDCGIEYKINYEIIIIPLLKTFKYGSRKCCTNCKNFIEHKYNSRSCELNVFASSIEDINFNKIYCDDFEKVE